MKLNIIRAIWFWLWPYSTKVIHGVQRGGQNHLAMGRAGLEIQRFLRGTGCIKRHGYWHFIVQPHGRYPAYQFTIGENPDTHQRPLECRLTCQSARSTNPYPIWKTDIPILRDGATPRCVIIFLLDSRFRIFPLVVKPLGLRALPQDMQRAICETVQSQRAHLWLAQGKHQMILDLSIKHRINRGTQGRSDDIDQVDPARVTHMGIKSAADEIVARLATLASMPRRKRAIKAHVLERSRSLRLLLLRLFGPKCQVLGCRFCRGIEKRLLHCIVDVHHLHHVAHSGSDAPDNLALLCSIHHAIMHRDPRLNITYSDVDDSVMVNSSFGSFKIERDLHILRND